MAFHYNDTKGITILDGRSIVVIIKKQNEKKRGEKYE